MRRLIILLKLLFKVKLIFKNPKKYDLVLFDDTSKVDFKNFIFNYNYFILPVRVENFSKIYFSSKILKKILKNYNGSLMTSYLVSLIEVINPKIVITNIDNSFKFSEIAKKLEKKISFVAIQNAARYGPVESKYLRKKKLFSYFNQKIYIPNFFCFGQYEIDQFKLYKIKIKKFFSIGSLRLANFIKYTKERKIRLKKNKYDIVLLSESPHIQREIFQDNSFKDKLCMLEKFTIKFCLKHNMKFKFLWRGGVHYKNEINFYKKYLNKKELDYLKNNSVVRKKNGLTSYFGLFESNILVGFRSTLLREKLAISGKILSVSLSSTRVWDFPIKGICSINNCSFQEFEKRLLNIYAISKQSYFSKIKKNRFYTMSFDKRISTIEIIKNQINYLMSKQKI